MGRQKAIVGLFVQMIAEMVAQLAFLLFSPWLRYGWNARAFPMTDPAKVTHDQYMRSILFVLMFLAVTLVEHGCLLFMCKHMGISLHREVGAFLHGCTRVRSDGFQSYLLATFAGHILQDYY